MRQFTVDQFNVDTLKHEAITVSDFTCPHCRQVSRFIAPDGSDLKDARVELEHYKKLTQQLMKDNFDLKMFCKRLAQQ